MKNNLTFFKSFLGTFFYACLIAALAGCHHPKGITKSGTEQADQQSNPQKPIDSNVLLLLKQLKSNEPVFSALAGKMKTKVSSPNLNQSFTTNIRWKKGEKIWLSMSIIGIEGARVLITRDSIKIMDKLNERYILKPLSFIKEKTLVDLSFSDIENLLLGQLIFTDTANAKFTENTSTTMVSADGVRFLTNSIFDKGTKSLNSIFVTDKMYAQTIESIYGNYQQQLGKSFAMDRNLKISSGPQTFEMNAKFQSLEIKDNLDYPFPINPSYTIEK